MLTRAPVGCAFFCGLDSAGGGLLNVDFGDGAVGGIIRIRFDIFSNGESDCGKADGLAG